METIKDYTGELQIIDGEPYLLMDKEDIIDGCGRLIFAKTPSFIKDLIRDKEYIETEDGRSLVRLALLLTGEAGADVEFTPMKISTPNSDNMVEPNDDGSYTLEFKNK